MNVGNLKCPNCGAQIGIPDDTGVEYAKCEYCDSAVYIGDVQYSRRKRLEAEQERRQQTARYDRQPVPAPVMSMPNVEAYDPHRRTCNKWTALLLCFFLGFLGVHKFYEGKTGMGALYLFTFGLFGIGWLVDLFILLARPQYYTP